MARVKQRPTITAELMRELLAYEPETGSLTWRADRNYNAKAGQRVGARRPDGYLVFSLLGGHYLAHRAIWLMVTGDWPAHVIDHVNGDPADNRWANLRAATSSQNSMNTATPSRNTSGVKGVSYGKADGRWQAYIAVRGERIRLGRHRTLEAAVAARRSAEAEYHGDCAGNTFND